MAELSAARQWSTVVWLRFTSWRHGLKRRGSWLESVAGAGLSLLALLGSIVLAVAFGRLLTRTATADDAEALRLSLYVVLFILALFAVLLPILIGSGRRNGELARLQVFPMSRRSLLGLALSSSAVAGAHLFWYPSLLVVAVVGVILAPVRTAPGLLVLMLLAACLVVWSWSSLMVLEAVTRRRSARELVTVCAFGSLMVAGLLPAIIDNGGFHLRDTRVLANIGTEVLLLVIRALPPSKAAEGLVGLATADATWPWLLLLELAAWAIAGVVLGALMMDRVLLEPASPRVPRPRHRRTSSAEGGESYPARLDVLQLLPPAVHAVYAKELRYLLRSTPGKLMLLLSPLFVLMISLAVGKLSIVRRPLFGMHPEVYAFYGVLVYTSLFSSNFVVNAFAWEGAGFKAYLLGPVSGRQVLLGKNLAVMSFLMMSLAESLAVWTLVRGVPSWPTVASGVMVFTCGLLVMVAAGNFSSIAFPVKRSIAAVTNSASNVGSLTSFAAVAVAVLLVLPVLLVGMAAGGGVWQLLFLGLLVAALAVLNLLLLQPAADLFEERSERLMSILDGTGDV